MNSQEYWKERALLAKQKEMASNAEYEVAMRSRLKDLENEFIKESKKWVTKYAKENNQSLRQAADYLNSIDTSKFDMTLAEFEAKARAGGFEKELNSAYYKTRIARLQELYRQYQELAARFADNEENTMAIGLAKRYEDTYLLENYNKYLVVGGLDVNFAHFNEQELKDIVYQPWKGSNFSKRIWNNYTKVMPEVLTDTMFRSTALGYSYNRIERMLRDKFQGVVKSNIHRLVVTEMGHAAEEATAKFYKDSDIKQYQYLATLETHTCEACAHLDERIFDVKDKREGINYPLLHPYCRCTTVPYMEGLPDIPTRWYRDPITGKGKWTRNMNYSEWAKATGAKSFSKKKFIEAKTRLGLAKLLHISGALNMSDPKDYGRALRHAKRYYEELRNSDRVYIEQHIVQGSGLNRSIVNSALIHILDSEYDLIGNNGKHSYQKFSPDYDMAESLQRLILEEPEDHDIIMLQHEALEAHYMDDLGMNYTAAHLKANKSYNYQKALAKFLERRDKQ
nr:MAG TPA: minor capsid protein [Caudoviricetes sp.]